MGRRVLVPSVAVLGSVLRSVLCYIRAEIEERCARRRTLVAAASRSILEPSFQDPFVSLRNSIRSSPRMESERGNPKPVAKGYRLHGTNKRFRGGSEEGCGEESVNRSIRKNHEFSMFKRQEEPDLSVYDMDLDWIENEDEIKLMIGNGDGEGCSPPKSLSKVSVAPSQEEEKILDEVELSRCKSDAMGNKGPKSDSSLKGGENLPMDEEAVGQQDKDDSMRDRQVVPVKRDGQISSEGCDVLKTELNDDIEERLPETIAEFHEKPEQEVCIQAPARQEDRTQKVDVTEMDASVGGSSISHHDSQSIPVVERPVRLDKNSSYVDVCTTPTAEEAPYNKAAGGMGSKIHVRKDVVNRPNISIDCVDATISHETCVEQVDQAVSLGAHGTYTISVQETIVPQISEPAGDTPAPVESMAGILYSARDKLKHMTEEIKSMSEDLSTTQVQYTILHNRAMMLWSVDLQAKFRRMMDMAESAAELARKSEGHEFPYKGVSEFLSNDLKDTVT